MADPFRRLASVEHVLPLTFSKTYPQLPFWGHNKWDAIPSPSPLLQACGYSFLDLSDRGISVEGLLRQAGLLKSALEEKHKDEYFKSNLAIGQKDMIYSFGKKK
ncbi:MAG: hypothetical protein AABY54_09390 [Deltaproteobacteria bacterium]